VYDNRIVETAPYYDWHAVLALLLVLIFAIEDFWLRW